MNESNNRCLIKALDIMVTALEKYEKEGKSNAVSYINSEILELESTHNKDTNQEVDK